jgi:transcriptional regulator with XRE-family HTH domain
MRTSQKKTPVAVLRATIGIKDIELAEILNCSSATIHSLESGRLKLSEAMAVRISHETGAAVSWLLEGRPTAPVSKVGKPYTREIFERTRAKEENPFDPLISTFTADACSRAIEAILATAERRGDLLLASYKIGKSVQNLVKEFCSAKDIAENESLAFGLEPVDRDGKRWPRNTPAEIRRELRRARSFFAKRKGQA